MAWISIHIYYFWPPYSLQEAAEKKPADEAEINPDLTKVTWTSEKEKAEAEGEDKPLKGVEED